MSLLPTYLAKPARSEDDDEATKERNAEAFWVLWAAGYLRREGRLLNCV